MKRKSSEFKRLAKGSLMGHYPLVIGTTVVVTLITLAVTLLLSFIFGGNDTTSTILYYLTSLILTLLCGVLEIGPIYVMLNISRGKDAKFGDLFYGFTHQPDRIIIITILLFLVGVACMAPGAVVVIAGEIMRLSVVKLLGVFLMVVGAVFLFIFELSYSLSFFFYLDHPEYSAIDSMRESREHMQGNKGRLFYIMVSFIPLALLCILSCYIGMLWLAPYQQMTTLQFYREVIGEI